MYKTSFRVSLFVIILMLPLTALYAAGLGKLKLNSALGQPLSAEIDIVTASNDEISSLKASIASREAFTQAGVNYEPSFSSYKISIESRANGSPYIKLSSPQAVNDPFLNVLIELNWASGRLLREYAVLLDPVEVNAQNVATPVVSSTPVAAAQTNSDQTSIDKNNQQQISKPSNRPVASLNKNTYGPVARGDTLSSIARQVLPAGVDLNQMLVALYRANRDAFIANNMNLLRVGAVLNIPEKNEVDSIDSSTARSEIRMQVADWHNYKSRMASTSGELEAAGIRQSDQGKITTTIDKKSISSREAPAEVLRLSSGAQLGSKDGQSSDSALADRLRMMEEDAIARNLALKEANERVAMLEKSIENMKHLLELKDSVLAQAQIKAAGAVSSQEIKPEIKPVVKAAEKITPAPEENPAGNIDALTAEQQPPSLAQPPAQALTDASASPSQPIPGQEEDEDSLTDQIFAHIEYVGAVSIALLLTVLLLLKRRRDRLNEEAEMDEGNSHFSSEIKSRMATMAAAQAASSHAFAEEEKLEDSIGEDVDSYPERNEFEVDSSDTSYPAGIVASVAPLSQHDSMNEERDSRTLHEIDESSDNTVYDFSRAKDADSISSPTLPDDENDFAVASDHSVTDADTEEVSVDFPHAIDFDLADDSNYDDLADKSSLAGGRDSKNGIELSDGSADRSSSLNSSDHEIDPDLEDSKDSFTTDEMEEIATLQENSLEYEPVNQDFNLTEDAQLHEETAENQDVDGSDELKLALNDINQQQDAGEHDVASEQSSPLPDLGLADISLDIEEDAGSVEDKSEIADSSVKSEQWQEVETKLDLAKAYQEMDDKEGAKEMLEEVIRDGDGKQKKAARKLLKSL